MENTPLSRFSGQEKPTKLSPEDRAWIDRALQAIVEAEAGPSTADIASAPILSDWTSAICLFGNVNLVGSVTKHPTLESQIISTSHLIAINPAAGWARTMSRWYQLAQPVPMTNRAMAQRFGMDPETAAMTRFTLTGMVTLDHMPTLNEFLAGNIAWFRRLDAADRAASEGED